MIEWLAAGAALLWLFSGDDKKKDKTKKQIEDIEIVKHILSEKEKNEILAFDKSLKCLLSIQSKYVKEITIQELLNKYEKVFNELQYASIDSFDDEEMYHITQTYFQLLNGEIQVQKKYIEEELNKNKELFDNIDGKSLDLQQREAVVTDEENSLIIAGAGSGKTLTIAAKVKYLCDVKKINPKDILLVTFTKKAADEMYERINNKLGIDVEVKTFHSLGYEIIGHFTEKKPSVFEGDISKKFLKSCIENDLELQRKLITFFSLYTCDSFEADMYDNIGEYYNNNSFNYYETIKQKVTLKGERVKSKQELAIANFFFINGIKYEYEKDYKFDTRSKYHRQYKPDFYLPTIDVYIEHFSIDENEKCPQYTKIEEIKYLEGIEYKRNLHRKYNTTMEETYSYDFTNGNIYTKLNNILVKYSLKKKIMPENYVHICIEKLNKDKRYREYFNLLNTFLALFKSNGYNENNIMQMLVEAYNKKTNYVREKHLLFLDIFKQYYNFYQNELKTNDKIDFNDMINMSTKYIEENSINEFNYKYIIIDEFQDISFSRYKLIKKLKNKNNSQVIAVGDDWQSIYRFAGSDISIFTKFKEYFGNTKNLKIEKTYRNSKELIDIAGNFIMENDEQIKKELTSAKRQLNPIEVIYYNEYSKDQNSFEMMLNWILQKIEDKEKKIIMLLGRHGFDIDILNKSKLFDIKTEKNGNKIIHSKLYEKVSIIFMTIHKSKGLEADEVIVINNKNNIVGFPNKVMNDPILDYVLQNDSNFLFDEERRLFYVALTRTKNKCYLMTPKDNPSYFVEQLLSKYNITEFNNQLIGTQLYCPKCLTGHLVERKSKNRTFLGCSNYPQCDYTLNVTKDKNVLSCPSCGGYLILREPYDFYGCSNYPHCTFKINKIDAIGSKYQAKTSKKEWIEQQNKFFNYKKTNLSKPYLEELLKLYEEE